MATGTYTIDDLLAVRFTTAKKFGLDIIADVLARDLAAHNVLVSTMMSELADTGTDARRLYGGTNDSYMTEVDEFGRSATQRALAGQECGFPLRLFQYAVGWTRKFLENATPADLAAKQIYAQKAHLLELQRQIKKALLNSTNYSFVDFLVDNVSLPVKRLVNADSVAIPDGPNGEQFTASSHTHYFGDATMNDAEMLAFIGTVIEHGHGNQLRLAINTAQEAAMRLLASFTPYLDPRIAYGSATNVANKRLDVSRVDNRPIGLFGPAEVWVKSWVPALYLFTWDVGDSRKPLYLRYRNGGFGLKLAAEFDTFPLQAQYFESEFGIGVWTRTNGAAYFVDAGATWVDPTIA